MPPGDGRTHDPCGGEVVDGKLPTRTPGWTRCRRPTGHRALIEPLQRHGLAVFGEPGPESGTPLYTDVRLYGEHGVPAVIYGAGTRTVLDSNAKRADEHLVLEDLRRATKVIACTLLDLLRG